MPRSLNLRKMRGQLVWLCVQLDPWSNYLVAAVTNRLTGRLVKKYPRLLRAALEKECVQYVSMWIYMFLYYPWCFTKESWRYKSKRKFTSSTSPWVWEVLPLQEVFPNTSSSVRSKAGRWLGTWPKVPEKNPPWNGKDTVDGNQKSWRSPVEVGKYPIIYSE